MIVGTVKDWKVYKVEDLRELSFSQVNEAVEFEDWMITIFGVEPGATPSPSTPGGHHRRNPPEPPLPPRRDDTFDLPEVLEIPEDRRPADIVGGGAYEDDQPQQPGQREGEAEEEEFEPSEDAGQLRPIYGLTTTYDEFFKSYLNWLRLETTTRRNDFFLDYTNDFGTARSTTTSTYCDDVVWTLMC